LHPIPGSRWLPLILSNPQAFLPWLWQLPLVRLIIPHQRPFLSVHAASRKDESDTFAPLGDGYRMAAHSRTTSSPEREPVSSPARMIH